MQQSEVLLWFIYIFIRHEGSTRNSNAKHITNHYNDLRKEKKERKKRKEKKEK